MLWRRQWHPTPVLLPGKSHGRRSLVGCSPWCHEESDTTERLHFHLSLSCTGEGNGNPLQCSCLENPRDGGDWWAAVYGVAQSRTRLKRLSSSRYCWDTWEGGESSTCLCYCSLPVAHKHFQGFPNLWYSGHSSMTILCNFRLYPVYTIFQMITKLTLFIYPRMRIRRRQWHPTPVLLPGKSHGQRSLVGCSPWGRWESDMTEWLCFHFSLSRIGGGNGNPLQCSCLENPRDRGAWGAAVYGVAQSQTRLKWLSSISDIIWYSLSYYDNL